MISHTSPSLSLLWVGVQVQEAINQAFEDPGNGWDLDAQRSSIPHEPSGPWKWQSGLGCQRQSKLASKPFLKRFRRVGASIEAIAMDIWPAHISAVFYRYQVISGSNKMLGELMQQGATQTSKSRERGIPITARQGRGKYQGRHNCHDKAQSPLGTKPDPPYNLHPASQKVYK